MTWRLQGKVAFVTMLAGIGACAPEGSTDAPPPSLADVRPAVETAAVASKDMDAADDPAIWAAPTGRSFTLAGRSVTGFVAGTDKKAGLYIYDLDGKQLQFLPDGLLNNVDLRDDVMVAGRSQIVLAASDRGRMGIALYLLDPGSTDPGNRVRPWGLIKSDLAEPYGICMAQLNGQLHAVVIGKDGEVRQYHIQAGPDGAAGKEVRRFTVGTQSEGCVADDVTGSLYIGEEAKGLWRYGLAPNSGNTRSLIQAVGVDGRLVADVEGVALIRDGSRSFLLVSSQGDSAFAVWRVDGPAPAYAGRFRVAAANGIDAVSGTDGIDALGGPVGPFPEGLVVVQDDENEGKSQNFKLIDWREVRQALRLDR